MGCPKLFWNPVLSKCVAFKILASHAGLEEPWQNHGGRSQVWSLLSVDHWRDWFGFLSPEVSEAFSGPVENWMAKVQGCTPEWGPRAPFDWPYQCPCLESIGDWLRPKVFWCNQYLMVCFIVLTFGPMYEEKSWQGNGYIPKSWRFQVLWQHGPWWCVQRHRASWAGRGVSSALDLRADSNRIASGPVPYREQGPRENPWYYPLPDLGNWQEREHHRNHRQPEVQVVLSDLSWTSGVLFWNHTICWSMHFIKFM